MRAQAKKSTSLSLQAHFPAEIRAAHLSLANNVGFGLQASATCFVHNYVLRIHSQSIGTKLFSRPTERR